jgi:hypothetical protein
MYKTNKKLLLFLLIITALTAITTVNVLPYTFSSPTPTLQIVPNSIITTTLTPGSTITLNASVTDITDLVTWQVRIYYNSSLLNCTNAWYPTDYVFAGKFTVPVDPTIDNTAGYVQHGCTLLSGGGFTGNGTLCQINFTVLSRGNCTIRFSEPYGDKTFLWDSNDNLISATIINGYFDNREPLPIYTLTITSTTGGTTNPALGSYQYPQGTKVTVTAIPTAPYTFDHWLLDDSDAGNTNPINVTMDTNHTLHAIFQPPIGITKIYVDPPEIIDPTMLPSSSFAINITINQVADMKICQFNFTYDPNILSWISVDIYKVQNQTPSPKVISDDEAGYLWIKLTYPNPVTFATPTALVRITLHVDAVGVSNLNLTDTNLTDSLGQPTSYITENGFFASLIQDLAITNVFPFQDWIFQGQPLNINVTVKNLGNTKESFDVKPYYNSHLINAEHVTDLLPDTEITLTFTWDTSTVTPGNYTITAEATILPYEENTTDNTYIDGTVEVLIQDIAVTNVVPSHEWAFKGWQVYINVTAKNLGNRNESFDLKAYYDKELIGTQHIMDLAPDTEITLTFTWNTSLAEACNNYPITGEAEILPYETNTVNNIYTDGNVKIRYMGDMNGDNIVDMIDIRKIAKAFASYPGHPRWDPFADLDQNDFIDMIDIRIAAKNFGKGCLP